MGDRILVVDDERNIRHVLRDLLLFGDSGYAVEEASDGQQALEMLRAEPFDVVLADIMMPRLSGVELLRIAAEEFPKLPFIMITAVRDPGEVLECLKAGAWDYILKPFELQQVRAAVRRAITVVRTMPPEMRDLQIVSCGPSWLELTASSEIEYLQRFRKFTEVLLGARISSAEREDIRLAVEELGRNAIEWGNRYERQKKVRLSYSLQPDRIVFRIEDEGEGFLHQAVPDPSADPVKHMTRRRDEGKRPGGYGIFIVRQVMDEVKFNDRGNAVEMVKMLS